MIANLLDHIWQSSLFAGGVAVLVLFFRRNRASLRFWLWFAASLKFLVPFAALAALGEYLSHRLPAAVPPSILAIQPAAEKFSAPAKMLAASHGQTLGLAQGWTQGISLASLLIAGWLAGFAAILCLHGLRWVRLRRLTQTAQDLPQNLSHGLSMPAPVRIKASPSLMEPGLVGIFRPVVLLPVGLMAFLSGPERESILAHELSHLSRRDNITAAVHMAVEALFWFYPPVWLIGAQMIAERERACDESVLASGHDPEVYAGGILKVCKFCIRSPMACASGVSGSDLGNRVRQIMNNDAVLGLGHAQRMLLAGTAMLALMLPVMAGFANAPLMVQVKRNVIAVQARAQQAVTAMVQDIAVPKIDATTPVTVQKLPRLKAPDVAAASPPPFSLQAAPLPVPQGAADAAPQTQAAPQPAAEAQGGTAATTPPAANEAATVLHPTGTGDPDALTCRAPQQLPDSRLPGPQVCKTNRQWAELRAAHQDIGPDGRTIVQLDGAKRDAAVCNNIRTLDWATSNTGKLPGNFCF